MTDWLTGCLAAAGVNGSTDGGAYPNLNPNPNQEYVQRLERELQA